MTLAAFEDRIRERDGFKCRWCELPVGRGKVYRLYPERLPKDERAALLLCDQCYRHLDGQVPGYYWRIMGFSHFELGRGSYIDASKTVCFESTKR